MPESKPYRACAKCGRYLDTATSRFTVSDEELAETHQKFHPECKGAEVMI